MGILRLLLALSVVFGHSQTALSPYVELPSAFVAVNVFFIISGFYMSMVLNTKYVGIPVRKFYSGRALRLAPVYFIGLLLMLLVSWKDIFGFFQSLTGISQAFFLTSNLFIAGQDLPYVLCFPTSNGDCAYPSAMTINPVSWSLALEVGFYLLAPYVVTRPKRLYLFIFIGLFYQVAIRFLTSPAEGVFGIFQRDFDQWRYFFYPSSFVFFGLGALAYLFSTGKIKIKLWQVITLIPLLFLSSTNIPSWQLILICLAIPLLFKISKESKIDRFIGELSYPVYIFHFAILIAIEKVVAIYPWLFEYVQKGFWVAGIAIIASILTVKFVENRVNSYRGSALSMTQKEINNKSIKFQTLWKSCRWTYGVIYFVFPFALITYVFISQQ